MVTRASNDGSWSSNALAFDSTKMMVSKSNQTKKEDRDSNGIAGMRGVRNRKGKTYEKQREERHHRQSRPCTFRNYGIHQSHIHKSCILESEVYWSWYWMVEQLPHSQILSPKSDCGAYPLSMTRAAASSVERKRISK